jgi:predicted ester cyclase
MSGEQRLDQNKTTIRRWGELVWNRGDFSATADLIAPDFICHRAEGLDELRGRDAHDRWVAEVRERTPGFRVEILDLIAEGDTVASRWRGTGIGMHFYRMDEGRIAEMWTLVDRRDG